MAKRLLDICLSLTLLVPASIVIALAAIWIKFDSSGPALFRQVRLGKNQIPFTMLKLRTMRTETGDRASHEVSASQITKAGRFLRRTKFDELPQLFSVLIGDMSFVGPRPCLQTQFALIEARARTSAFSVLPGITGPAQIANVDMSTPEKLSEIDGQYVAERTLLLDLKYIWFTAFGSGRGDAVNEK